jgi:glycosyltransferase involved in cell wall biosynthesis
MKLLTVQIAHGFCSEVQVASRFFGARAGAYDVRVVAQEWSEDRATSRRIAETANAEVTGFDFGWRPDLDYSRSRADKALSWVGLARHLPAIVKLARDYRPDAVYSSQQRWDCLVSNAVSAALGIPQLIHLHYIVGPWLGKHTLWRLRACERVIAISDFVRAQAAGAGVPEQHLRRVLNPLAPAADPPPEEVARLRRELLGTGADKLVGFVARLYDYKGHRETLRAFARVARALPRVKLVMVGDGPLRHVLPELARELGLGDQVLFTGHRKDVPALLGAFDLFVHPSRDEPFGLAILEAQAAGLPVVAFAEGGIPEIVRSGETGLLVPPDDEAALGRAIQELIADDGARARMAECARTLAQERFATERLAPEFTRALWDR